jgi:hypothetical protein
VSIHNLDHHIGLGCLRTTGSRILLSVPRSLCFIEDDHPLHWFLLVLAIVMICESMDIVYEGAHFQLRLPAAHSHVRPTAFNNISDERLLNDFYEWTITRQE